MCHFACVLLSCRYGSDSHVYAFFVIQWVLLSIAVMLLFFMPETRAAVRPCEQTVTVR
jgi:hypothetical protein